MDAEKEVFVFPMSFSQQRLWFLDRLEPNNSAYNMYTAFHIENGLNISVLQKSVDKIINRHESLRTTFAVDDNDEPIQIILPFLALAIQVVDLTGHPAAKREIEAKRLAVEAVEQPFDLTRGPLLRVVLYKLDARVYTFVLVMHHIITDGWSMGVFIRELMSLYNAFLAGKSSPFPELPIQYADYSVWQREWLQGDALEEQLAYWKGQLAGIPPVFELPIMKSRPTVPNYKGDVLSFKLPYSLSIALKRLSQREGCTLYMTLLTAFNVLLNRYSGRTDILIGTSTAGRNRAELEALIGFFVNTLVLRTRFSVGLTFLDLLHQVRETTLDAYAHQDLPFEKLVEELAPERSLNWNPLFQIEFTLQNAPNVSLDLQGLVISSWPVENHTSKFDLSLNMWETSNGLAGILEYSTDLFEADVVQRMIGHWQVLLQGIVSDAESPIWKLPILTEMERQGISKWNQTEADYPREKLFHQLFEEQVQRTPNAIAAGCEGQCLTYQELNKQANILAHCLSVNNIGADDLVGFYFERGILYLVAILAVFKAGGAYLPLDLNHPKQRLQTVLEVSRARLILVARQHGAHLSQMICDQTGEKGIKILILEDILEKAGETTNLSTRCTTSNLAYVIFTSGSTGIPKGAMVEHRGMLNHLYAKISDLNISASDKMAQTAPQYFDISVWQFLVPLLVGGQVQIFKDEVALDPNRLVRSLEKHAITIWETVPALLRLILDSQLEPLNPIERPNLKCLRWLIVTGEDLPMELCRRWSNCYEGIPLLNAYGPTECSDDVTHYRVESSHVYVRTPIGCPIANLRIYVLDQFQQPVPAGVIGEIYVGGEGVGRGYLHDPYKTAAVFYPDPFASDPGARMYKTGDLGRYLSTGVLEFLGRVDFQIKIHGLRIELGEIESQIISYPGVQNAAVLVYKGPDNEPRLIAYVVPHNGKTDESDGRIFAVSLQERLREYLPRYMIPASIVLLPVLPLTPNGKLDRRSLPIPDTDMSEREPSSAVPDTIIEKRLVEIIKQKLAVEQMGVHDNFFELGGHSLLVMSVISSIRTEFQIDLPLKTMFESPTVAELANTIEAIQWVAKSKRDTNNALGENRGQRESGEL